PDGRVGTRNYVAIVSTVNCSSHTAKLVARRLEPEIKAKYPNVDGVIAVTHAGGCGMAHDGLDRRNLQKTLAGYARHPNVFDYVVLGLGCETNHAGDLFTAEHLLGNLRRPPPLVTIQGSGGIEKGAADTRAALEKILPAANEARRTRQPASKIVLATKCGGSDGYSGITANPALGVASDLLVAQGGTSILAETTEIYGAEHLLTRRAVSREVGEKLVERIKWWEWYTAIFGAAINNNPSHGNKAGGLTTIYEKSLGAVAKAGRSALVDVYQYADPVTAAGLVVMDTPGFDPVAVTGMVAGGANVVVFTTGRGSVFGCKPAPSIKVATNSPLYEFMISDMDFDAGVVLAGVPMETVGRRMLDEILAVASGKPTKSEAQDVGDDEFVPWTIGPTL
ncbi:MAG: UxaA family hydrolase, partial [Planctomycetia bacterium]